MHRGWLSRTQTSPHSPGWFPSCCGQGVQGRSPVGRTRELPPRPWVESFTFLKNRRAAERRYPGPCGHTLENHTSPGRLCFHCLDLWETCKTQAVWGAGGGAPGGALPATRPRRPWQSPFWNPSAFAKPS